MCLVITPQLNALELRTYNIRCESEDFNYIIDHPFEDRYIDCTLEFDGRVWEDVRIRIRGESSRHYPKKSFKVNFSSKDRFYGRDKLNLISEYMDASVSREYLAYELYHRAGLYASQTWYSKIYVNDQYIGLYLDVENVDEFYLERTDLDDNSSIYKADLNGTLLTPYEDVEALWEKKTNTETGFYDLENLIEWLDLVSDEDFFDGLADRFDTDDLARTIAVNALAANASTYYHNYYLINDLRKDGKWKMLPWDMDKTWSYNYYGQRPYYYRSGHQIRHKINALLRSCWRDNDFRDVIFGHMEGMIDSIFTDDYYSLKTDEIESLIFEAVSEDPNYQFPIEEFSSSIRQFPTLVRSRGEWLKEFIYHGAYPFDLESALIVPDGVMFSWEPAEYAGGLIDSYRVHISVDYVFPSGYIDFVTEEPFGFYQDLEPGEYYWRVQAFSPANLMTQSLSFFLPIIVPEGIEEGSDVSGIIETSTIWTIDESPYWVAGEVTISEGAVLTIDPGVIVGMSENSSLIIHGGLIVNGTVADSVSFVPTGMNDGWGGIILDNPTESILIKYTNFRNLSGGNSGQVIDGIIQIESGELIVENCNFTGGNSSCIIAVNSDVTLLRSRFQDYSQNYIDITGGSIVMQNCQLYSDKSDGDKDLVNVNDAENVRIQACSFYGGGDAIDIDNVVEAAITGNSINETLDKGITIGLDARNVSLTNNIIAHCGTGIAIHEDFKVSLFNNTIAFNGVGLAIYNSEPGSRAIVRNTVLWRNDVEIESDDFADLTVAYSMVRGSKVYPGENNYYKDAHFVDQWGDNYNLRSDSPLIDAGWGWDYPERDFQLNERVDVTEIANRGVGEIRYVDIGALEFGNILDYPPPPVSFNLFDVYPNPFNTIVYITFEVRQSEEVKIVVNDIQGRRLVSERFSPLYTGRYTHTLNASEMRMGSGLYFIQLESSGKNRTQKVVLIK